MLIKSGGTHIFLPFQNLSYRTLGIGESVSLPAYTIVLHQGDSGFVHASAIICDADVPYGSHGLLRVRSITFEE